MKSLGLRQCSLCQWIPAAIHYPCAHRPITEVVAGTSNSSISVVDIISINVTMGAILLLDDSGRVSDRGIRILGSDTVVVWSSVLALGKIFKGGSSLPLPSSPVPCPAANELNVVEITRWPAYVCRKNNGRMTSQLILVFRSSPSFTLLAVHTNHHKRLRGICNYHPLLKH